MVPQKLGQKKKAQPIKKYVISDREDVFDFEKRDGITKLRMKASEIIDEILPK